MKIRPTNLRERIAWAGVGLLCVVVAWLGLALSRALKSPAPAEWNTYSRAANDHLYDRLNPARPTASQIVAHRGGSGPAAGEPEPGPIARLDASYAAGLRLFELDFCWTADEELVVEHDWDSHPRIPTRDEFLAAAPGRGTLAMVYDWLDRHDDAFIVTDCKKRSLECCARIRMERPDLVPQFIVQIYTYKDHDLVRSLGFRNIILTLYRALSDETAGRLAEFLSRHEVFALTIPHRRADDEQLLTAARRLSVPVYVHTINDPVVARQLLDRGVHGVYSDVLSSLGTTARPATQTAE